MKLKEIIDRVDELKAKIETLRPIDPEQKQRIMQKFRLDWNFHSNHQAETIYVTPSNTLQLRYWW